MTLVHIDYGKIRRQAARYAKLHGHPNDAEDFAQECCIYAFERQTDEVFIQRRFSDYLRRNFGRAGSPGGDSRRAVARPSEVFNDEAHGFDSSNEFDPSERCDSHRIGFFLSKLEKYERLIYVLRHKYDVPITQIADSQGVSPGRISQVLKGIQTTVHKEVARSEPGVSRNGKTEVAGILSAQGERMECQEDIQMAGFKSFALESFNATCL